MIPVDFGDWPGRIVFGAGTVGRLAALVDRLGGRRALVLCGSTVAGGEMLVKVKAGLGDKLAAVFPEVRSHTPIEMVERGLVQFRAGGADVIVQWTDSVPPDVPPDTTSGPNSCGGVTTFEYDSTGFALTGPVHVSLTVLAGSPASAGQVQACMRRVSIHELGHSLGLLRHSLFDEDIMFGSPIVDYPSRFDRRSVELLYHSAPTVQPAPQ